MTRGSAGRGPAPVRAVIFDLDGLLIDSEPLWREGESRIFRSLGMPVEPEDIRATMGMRLDEAVAYWHAHHPWRDGHTHQEVMAMVEAEMVRLIRERGEPLPGARQAIALARELGLRTAIASSSTAPVIDAALDRIGVRDLVEVVRSAADEPYGKPHPAVYLTTAALLGVPPRACLAFEDSVAGVIAAKAAGMTCVAVPDAHTRTRPEMGAADEVLGSLTEVTPEFYRRYTAGGAHAAR